MNRNLLVQLVGIVVVLALGAGAWWWWTNIVNVAPTALKVSGTLEADKVRVSAEVGGLVATLNVADGQSVKAGDILAQVNDATAQAQYAQAQAALAIAQANLALLQAGATPEQVTEVEAQVAQAAASLALAQANLTGLVGNARPEMVRARWEALQIARTNYAAIQGSLTPDALNELVNAANTAEGNLKQAKARYDSIAKDQRTPQYTLAEMQLAVAEAQAMHTAMQAIVKLSEGEGLLNYQVIEQTQLALELAKSNRAIASARLDALTADDRTPSDALTFGEDALSDAETLEDDVQTALEALQDDPLGQRLTAAWEAVTTTQTALNDLLPAVTTTGPGGTTTTSRATGAAVEAALRQIEVATAAHDFAVARLAEVQAGARTEQLAVAEAQVASAQAQVQLLEIQLAKYTIRAPIDGIILSRGVAVGEMTAPGAVLFEIGDLQHLQLTVYLPEEYFGLVKPGDESPVATDAYGDRTFTAIVDRLASQAEYTSRNVQTVEGRRDTVFAMYLRIDNTDLALVPGMWADVTFPLK